LPFFDKKKQTIYSMKLVYRVWLVQQEGLACPESREERADPVYLDLRLVPCVTIRPGVSGPKA
jgi:hypothetical protein